DGIRADSEIQGEGFRSWREGKAVEFEMVQVQKGPQATKLVPK
ncbi:MAG: cold shock domain-containing protein, partial [Nitrospinae bacterium]|nr:cold shock domain-containing protein [Nitrospinota bacterium]